MVRGGGGTALTNHVERKVRNTDKTNEFFLIKKVNPTTEKIELTTCCHLLQLINITCKN